MSDFAEWAEAWGVFMPNGQLLEWHDAAHGVAFPMLFPSSQAASVLAMKVTASSGRDVSVRRVFGVEELTTADLAACNRRQAELLAFIRERLVRGGGDPNASTTAMVEHLMDELAHRREAAVREHNRRGEE